MAEEQTELGFESIVARLEQIAKQLESGDTKLEQALALFEEGVRLAKLGNRRLDEAERKIEILLQDDKTAPFRPEGEPEGNSSR